MLQHDRRRFQRVALRQPIRAFVGPVPVQLVDASIAGVRVVHQAPLPPAGTTCRIMFQSEFGPISVDCEIVHTETAGADHYTGLRVLAADRQSQERLREMVAMISARKRTQSEH